MMFNKLVIIGKLKKSINILPAKTILSPSEVFPLSVQILEENSVKYPTPTIFKTEANSSWFIPVFSTKLVISCIMETTISKHIDIAKNEPTILIKKAISGFDGFTII